MAQGAPQAFASQALQVVPCPGARQRPAPSHCRATGLALIGQGRPGAQGSQGSPQAFLAHGS
jgi:hypothetical protein